MSEFMQQLRELCDRGIGSVPDWLLDAKGKQVGAALSGVPTTTAIVITAGILYALIVQHEQGERRPS